MQAAAALQAGRELLMLNPCNNSVEKGPSLAVELLAGMNQDQVYYSSIFLKNIILNIFISFSSFCCFGLLQIDGQLSGDNGEPCNISEVCVKF